MQLTQFWKSVIFILHFLCVLCLFFPLVSSAFSVFTYDISANETGGLSVVMKDVAHIKTFTCFYSNQTTQKLQWDVIPPAGGFDSPAHYPHPLSFKLFKTIADKRAEMELNHFPQGRKREVRFSVVLSIFCSSSCLLCWNTAEMTLGKWNEELFSNYKHTLTISFINQQDLQPVNERKIQFGVNKNDGTLEKKCDWCDDNSLSLKRQALASSSERLQVRSHWRRLNGRRAPSCCTAGSS